MKPAAAGLAPVTAKAASPKKETARIQLPPDPKPLPKATVKMTQTRPVVTGPAATVTPAPAVVNPVVVEESSPVLPIAAAILALAAVGIQLWIFMA